MRPKNSENHEKTTNQPNHEMPITSQIRSKHLHANNYDVVHITEAGLRKKLPDLKGTKQ